MDQIRLLYLWKGILILYSLILGSPFTGRIVNPSKGSEEAIVLHLHYGDYVSVALWTVSCLGRHCTLLSSDKAWMQSFTRCRAVPERKVNVELNGQDLSRKVEASGQDFLITQFILRCPVK